MKRSEQVGELVSALAKAQAEFTPALKDSKNPYYNSKYADLAAVIGAVRPALNKHGIILTQDISADLERQVAIVRTSLYHGEQFFEIEIEAPAKGQSKKDEQSGMAGTKFDVQTIGAGTLYLRRYSVAAICGLAAEDDEEDDGNSLDGNNKPIAKKAICPVCGKDAIIQGKPEYGGGWLCYKAKGGCGWKTDTNPALVQESHETAQPASMQQSVQQATQRAASAPAANQPQAGQLKFIPPNGLITTIKGFKEIAAETIVKYQAATDTEPEVPERKRKAYMIVNFLGQHNGVGFASCFDTKYWDLLKESVGLECHFQIKEADKGGAHFINIVDVIYVDGQEYTDGKPVTA